MITIIVLVVLWLLLGVFESALLRKVFDDEDEVDPDDMYPTIMITIFAPLVFIVGALSAVVLLFWAYVLRPIHKLGVWAATKVPK